MNWISNVVPPKVRSLLRRETPENLWVKCPESGELVFHKDLEANLFVVPGSGYHMRLAPKARLDNLFDDGAYEEIATPEVPLDPLEFGATINPKIHDCVPGKTSHLMIGKVGRNIEKLSTGGKTPNPRPDMTASRTKFAIGYWSKGCTNAPGPIF